MDQTFELQVFPSYAHEGNTAVLRCLMPPFVRGFLTVTEWMAQGEQTVIRDEASNGEAVAGLSIKSCICSVYTFLQPTFQD